LSKTTYLGIDVGASGAAAALFPDGTVEICDLPVLMRESKKTKQKYIDPHELYNLLNDWKFLSYEKDWDTFVMIEHTQAMPRESARVAFSMGVARGTVLTAVALAKIPYEECLPTVWKRHFNLLKCDKEASRSAAIRLFPQAGDDLKRKLDHNRAEALLIAKYLKDKENGN